MYLTFLTIHSWLRWFLLAVMLFVLVRSFIGWFSKSGYSKTDNLLGVLLIAFAHTQLIVGYILYFYSPLAYGAIQSKGMGVMKDATTRIWAVEHIAVMTIAVILIQVGRSLSKKQPSDAQKHQRMAIFTVIALALIMSMIPMDRIALFRY